MGISREDLRRIIRRAMARATDPMQLVLLALWRRLTPDEQRLTYLHRFLGLSLREIARRGLIEGRRGDGPASPSALRRTMRRIRRKVARATHPSQLAPGESTGGITLPTPRPDR